MKFNRHPVFSIIGQLKDVVIKTNFFQMGVEKKPFKKLLELKKINDKN
jgi:hypothetical protein